MLSQILRGLSDANVEFEDLCQLLKYLGFEMRIKGSHHVFRKTGVIQKINLQRQGAKAKPYQVKQVRQLILQYQLAREE